MSRKERDEYVLTCPPTDKRVSVVQGTGWKWTRSRVFGDGTDLIGINAWFYYLFLVVILVGAMGLAESVVHHFTDGPRKPQIVYVHVHSDAALPGYVKADGEKK